MKTFDEVTMDNGTDDNLGVSHKNLVLDLNTAAWFHKALCSAQFDCVSGFFWEWFVATFSLCHYTMFFSLCCVTHNVPFHFH